MFDFSPLQIAIVVLLALLIFGPKRLPELGRGLGSGIRDFKTGLTGDAAPTSGDGQVRVAQDARAGAGTTELEPHGSGFGSDRLGASAGGPRRSDTT